MRNNNNGKMIDWTSISLRRIVHVSLLAALAACASVDFDYPKTESTAVDSTDNTSTNRQFSELVAAHPGESGFWLLFDGIDALALRLLMAERAERSIDTQYYLITNDLIGYVFIGSHMQAADRGVRERLLLDDIQTKGYDAGMAALDSHPNFEVRIFNPWSGRGSRTGLNEFGRINRRMHNKSFTVDNQATILGGRNIGDEYFEAHPDLAFSGLDVLAIGPVVKEVSASFDQYWNNELAYPATVLQEKPPTPEEIEQKHRQLNEFIVQQSDSAYLQALRNSDLADNIRQNRVHFNWGQAEIISDQPEKLQHDFDKTEYHLAPKLKPYLEDVKRELIIGIADGEQRVFNVDPYTGFWKRLGVALMGILPIESQL